MCHCVWNQQMRSGIEIVDCEKLSAFARPDSLKGSPAQSSGFGPAPRSIASSWLIEAHDPDRSISACAGAPDERINAHARDGASHFIVDSHGPPEGGPYVRTCVLPRCRTWRGFPLRVVRLFLELRGDHERLPQIHRVGR